jgi:hypothetical protein
MWAAETHSGQQQSSGSSHSVQTQFNC